MTAMIEINLLPGARKRKSKGGGPSFQLPDFKELISKLNADPLLIGAIGTWVVAVIVVSTVHVLESGKINELQPKLQQLQTQKRRYNRELVLQRQSDSLLSRLENELTSIRRIDSDRYNWPHILDEIARALPEFTWLRSVDRLTTLEDLGGGEAVDTGERDLPTIQIVGETGDPQMTTRFVRRLSDSPWFTNVVLGRNQLITGDNDRSVNEFQIQMTFQVPDSAFIRTVPILSEME